MKFSVSAAVLLLSSSAFAAVIERRLIDTLKPDTYGIVRQNTPDAAAVCGSNGEITRTNGDRNSDDVETIAFFNIPAAYASKSCTLVFNNPSFVSGSGQTQVFTSTNNPPLTCAQSTYNNRHPNNHVATFQTVVNGAGTQTFGSPFTCGSGPTNFVLRPVNDDDSIKFALPNGLNIQVS